MGVTMTTTQSLIPLGNNRYLCCITYTATGDGTGGAITGYPTIKGLVIGKDLLTFLDGDLYQTGTATTYSRLTFQPNHFDLMIQGSGSSVGLLAGASNVGAEGYLGATQWQWNPSAVKRNVLLGHPLQEPEIALWIGTNTNGASYAANARFLITRSPK